MADGPVVCVVGAGTAGLEALLALHGELGADAALRLIAPDPEFRYRPMSRESLFRPAPERVLAVADVVDHAGARWLQDRADLVDQGERTVLTRDGETVPFDHLLLAPGARSSRALRQGYAWERGADPGFLDEMLAAIAAGAIASVAVVVPRGARWPVPAYELALVLAWTAHGTGARVTLITAEPRPLGALGPQAGLAAERELSEAAVELICGVEALDGNGRPGGPGTAGAPPAELLLVPEGAAAGAEALVGEPSDPARVRTVDGSRASFERLISLPTIAGPFIGGVATDALGFVEVDEDLRVCGGERVWAAGACIAAALEHSALSAQQADAAAAAIAAACRGEPPGEAARAPDLTGILLAARREQWLAENPAGTTEPSTRCLWWPPGRAVGSMLAGRIAAWDPSLHRELAAHPGGLEIRTPVALGCAGGAGVAAESASAADRAARLHDIETRQQMALARREREAAAELDALSARLDSLAERQERVVHELQRHGYLRDRP